MPPTDWPTMMKRSVFTNTQEVIWRNLAAKMTSKTGRGCGQKARLPIWRQEQDPAIRRQNLCWSESIWDQPLIKAGECESQHCEDFHGISPNFSDWVDAASSSSRFPRLSTPPPGLWVAKQFPSAVLQSCNLKLVTHKGACPAEPTPSFHPSPEL